MCDFPDRKGRALHDAEAHSEDHARWTRRQFLSTLGLAAAGGLALGSRSLRAMHHPALDLLDTDRVLVLVQLAGGNDGLNTIIPFRNDIYYRERPSLSIRQSEALVLDADHGLHPAMTDAHRLFLEGQMSVVQNVGYDNPSQSHFRSTDIWVSASDASVVENSGWAGRYLEQTLPTGTPERPPGVQLGAGSNVFLGRQSDYGMTIDNPGVFQRLAESGTLYPTDNLPNTPYGASAKYVRDVANNSVRYAKALQEAASRARPNGDYPSGSRLASNLSIIARLIRGDLGTRIYLVSLNGFDTHSQQLDMHASLLANVSASVHAFLEDLSSDGLDERVLLMTFSEFGRTYWENGAAGTDHSTGAPLFLFGPALAGGLVGESPDLTRTNEFGDPLHGIDFRQVYGSVLSEWLGADTATVESVLNGTFDPLPLFTTGVSTSPDLPATLSI
ncbi:MAG: DUF1501 domain-containing protein, partial [Bacteroidota bacterium]